MSDRPQAIPAMRLNRRDFNGLALAALAASMAGTSRVAAVEPAPARKTLNRLTFGANAEAIAEFRALGKGAWLERELAKPPADRALATRLAAATLRIEYEAGSDGPGKEWPARAEDWPYQYLDAKGDTLLPLVVYETGMEYSERIRPGWEVQAASLTRAVHADAQLREVMTQFWHDHFNVNAMKDEHTAAFFPMYDRVMRTHALGNFRTLLGEMARSPSMLFYLNNEASRASPANENFGRELLELHTLGTEHYFNDLYDDWKAVPGATEGLAQGYIDQDVYEVARAFTGWSFGDGRWIAEGDEAPRTGEFHYIDAWHDPYQKRVLGVEFRPNQGPLEDGDQVLDILARHPGTATFITRKIIRRLLTDDPEQGFVDRISRVFLEHAKAEDQIAQVIRAIVMSEEFDSIPARKLKRPFEFLVSLYRATGMDVKQPKLDFVWQLDQAGWSQHEFRPPTGHSDKSEDWANTNALNGLVNIALYAHEEWFGAGSFDVLGAVPDDVVTWGQGFAFWASRLGADSAELSAAFLTAADVNPDEPLPEDAGDRDWVMRAAITMAALTPQFLFR